MPEVLTQKGAPGPSARWPDKSRNGGRLHVGMVAGFKSEPRPASRRNTRPACVGIRNHVTVGDQMSRIESCEFALAFGKLTAGERALLIMATVEEMPY